MGFFFFFLDWHIHLHFFPKLWLDTRNKFSPKPNIYFFYNYYYIHICILATIRKRREIHCLLCEGFSSRYLDCLHTFLNFAFTFMHGLGAVHVMLFGASIYHGLSSTATFREFCLHFAQLVCLILSPFWMLSGSIKRTYLLQCLNPILPFHN